VRALLLLTVVVASAPAQSVTAFERAKIERLLDGALPCLGCHTLGGRGGRIGPPLDGVRDRRDPTYIARIVSDPQGVVPGAPMPHTPMPPATRTLLVRSLGGDPRAIVAAPTPAPTVGETPARYATWCAGCHGARGGGDGPNAAALPVAPARHADAAATAARPDDALHDTIHGGGAVMGRSARMPAYGTTFSPAQIRELVRYIRTLCRCAGPAWAR
jgi:mono/diheme cytochrome c family protein